MLKLQGGRREREDPLKIQNLRPWDNRTTTGTHKSKKGVKQKERCKVKEKAGIKGKSPPGKGGSKKKRGHHHRSLFQRQSRKAKSKAGKG